MIEFTYKIRCAGSENECRQVTSKLSKYLTPSGKKEDYFEHIYTKKLNSNLEADDLAYKIRQECYGMISAIKFRKSSMFV